MAPDSPPTLSGEALVILGAPRSGTSAVANAFRLLGYYLGEDKDFPEPKKGNPVGIFERQEILGFNNRCIEAMYLGHDRPDLFKIEEHPAFPRLTAEAGTVLRHVFSGHDRWGWKEPITTLLAPIYQAALAKAGVAPGYLLCVRRPSEVIASQSRIVDSAENHGEAPIGPRAYRRWISYTLKSLRYTRGLRRAMVAYDRLLEDPEQVLRPAFAAVTGGRAPDGAKLTAAIASIRGEFHRNRSDSEVPADAPAVMGDLWELCKRISNDPEGLGTDAYDVEVEQVAQDFDLLSTCFSEPEPPYGQVAFVVPGVQGGFGAVVTPSKGWNSVVIEVSARASTDLLGTLYPLPANAFVRNARWGETPARLRAINDTVEGLEGESTRFSLGFSSPQVVVRTPADPGPYRLTMEVFVEMNIFTAMDSLLRQTRKTRALETQLAGASDQLCKMEEQVMRLRQRPG